MAYDYEKVARLPVDSRIVDRINRSPKMMSEQGPGYMQGYGGGSQYMAVTKLTSNERVAFYAVQDGFDNTADIVMATGMGEEAVNKALSSLASKGLVVQQDQEIPVEK